MSSGGIHALALQVTVQPCGELLLLQRDCGNRMFINSV